MIGGNAARPRTGTGVRRRVVSPESGIIDSHGYMRALWGDLEDHGGMIAFERRSSTCAGRPALARLVRRPRSGTIDFDAVVNAAASAQALAAHRGLPAEHVRGSSSPKAIIRLRRPAGVLAAGLSTPVDGGSASTSPSISPAHAVRPRRRVDRRRNLQTMRRGPTPSMPASAPIGRTATIRWCPTIAASGPS